ncbi:hypothetical protein [Luteolibacter sp. AS25]|uniref:hypothetical protein n=1 Tax=Luteolibacter sp. AS25 TaxID=3135776 RepID=UPI00398AD786
MKPLLTLIFTLSLGISATTAQNVSWPSRLNEAYAFVLGQNMSLEAIIEKIPELAPSAGKASAAFDSSPYAKGFAGVRSTIEDELGEGYTAYEKNMAKMMSEAVSTQKFTEAAATTFISEIEARARGNMDAEVKRTLLATHPDFAGNPEAEMKQGFRQRFPAKGSPQATKAGFSVTFPASWRPWTQNDQYSLGLFRSQAGTGPIICNVMLNEIKAPSGQIATENDLKWLLQEENLKSILPAEATFISSEPTKLGGAPAAIMSFEQLSPRGDFRVRSTQFMTMDGNKLQSLLFFFRVVGEPEKSLDQMEKENLPTYQLIADTFTRSK